MYMELHLNLKLSQPLTPGTIYLSGVEPLMLRSILSEGNVCSEVTFDLDCEKSLRQLVQQR